MKSDLETAIGRAAMRCRRPDGTAYQGLPHRQTLAIARRSAIPVRQVELAALAIGIHPRRYARNGSTLDPAQQARLLASRVAVVGLGGLGGPLVEILARLGVGAMTLVDGDRFEETNLNRQILCTGQSLGHSKVLSAGRRLALVNPAVQVRLERHRLTAENAAALLAGAQLAMDCLDNLPDRFLLEAAARRTRIPLVSAAVGGSSGQLTVVHPEDSEDLGLCAVYGPAQDAPRHGAETRLGTLPQIVFTLAGLAANEALKILLDSGSILRGRLLIVDLMDNRFEVLRL